MSHLLVILPFCPETKLSREVMSSGLVPRLDLEHVSGLNLSERVPALIQAEEGLRILVGDLLALARRDAALDF